MTDYSNNIKLTIKSVSVPGQGQSITIYEWSINNIIHINKTDTLLVDTSTLQLGNNVISLRVKNSCGRWSDLYSKTINIIEAINMVYTQTETIDINAPNIIFGVKLRRKSTVVVTVVDEGDVPVTSVDVNIAGISGTTDTAGNVTLSLVPYGTQTVTTTAP